MLKKYIKKWLLLIHVLKGFFPVIVATDSLILYTYQLTYVHTAIFYPLFSKLQEGIKKATPETCSAEWLLFNICIGRIVNIVASAYKHSLCLTGLYSHNVYKAVIVVHVFTPFTTAVSVNCCTCLTEAGLRGVYLAVLGVQDSTQCKFIYHISNH